MGVVVGQDVDEPPSDEDDDVLDAEIVEDDKNE